MLTQSRNHTLSPIHCTVQLVAPKNSQLGFGVTAFSEYSLQIHSVIYSLYSLVILLIRLPVYAFGCNSQKEKVAE